jgi:maleate isomerase
MASNRPFVGVATPQANPTVEIETRALLDGYAIPLATRLTSAENTPADRLLAYLEQIDAAIRSFDTLPLAAFAFACTGSSYLAGAKREAALVRAAENRFRIPVVTATAAIAEELTLRNASRIAILAPYPEALIEASVEYWRAAGFEVVRCQRIDVGDDTRGIYSLTDSEVAAAIENYAPGDVDMLLMSGTGMPTMAALRSAMQPMLSSNLCLSAAVLRRTGLWPADEAIDLELLTASHA